MLGAVRPRHSSRPWWPWHGFAGRPGQQAIRRVEGGVRRQTSPRLVLRGHAHAQRRRRPHRGAVAGAPPAASRRCCRSCASVGPRRGPIATIPSPCAPCCCSAFSCCWSPSATARPTACALGLPIRPAGQGRGGSARCLGDAAGLHRQATHHAGRRRLTAACGNRRGRREPIEVPDQQRAGRARQRRRRSARLSLEAPGTTPMAPAALGGAGAGQRHGRRRDQARSAATRGTVIGPRSAARRWRAGRSK